MDKQFEPNTELKDALEMLGDRYQVQIVINSKAFEDDFQIKEVERQQVRLPKMTNISLGKVLQLLLSQVNGGYLPRSGYLEVTTLKRSYPQIMNTGDENAIVPELRALVPTVEVTLSNQPLATALRDLSESSRISVVLDQNHLTPEQSATLITAQFSNVPVDTAVRIVADMADLRAVAIDNVLYVTTDARAARFLRKDELKQSEKPEARSKDKKDGGPQKPAP